MRRNLGNNDDGRYLMTPATGSQSELDLTAATPRSSIFLGPGVSQLRRDSESVRLFRLEACARYRPQNIEDGLQTLMMPSPALQATPLAKPEA